MSKLGLLGYVATLVPGLLQVRRSTWIAAGLSMLVLLGLLALLLAFVMMLYIWFISKKRNYPHGLVVSFRQFFRATFNAIPALLTPDVRAVVLRGEWVSSCVFSSVQLQPVQVPAIGHIEIVVLGHRAGAG